MYNVMGNEVDGRVPVYRFNEDGTISNVRPTSYHTNAVKSMRSHGTSGIIGYKVKNRHGDVKPMTFKQYERLKNLFEDRFLEIVDYWRVHDAVMEMALTGYDTEGENSGIFEMPSFND